MSSQNQKEKFLIWMAEAKTGCWDTEASLGLSRGTKCAPGSHPVDPLLYPSPA